MRCSNAWVHCFPETGPECRNSSSASRIVHRGTREGGAEIGMRGREGGKRKKERDRECVFNNMK